MKVNLVNNKFIIDAEMDFPELEELIPFSAFIAEHDLRNKYKDCKYFIIDGSLYASGPDGGSGDIRWYYYDPSVRRWSECDKPEEKS